jgi:hypothetical protein
MPGNSPARLHLELLSPAGVSWEDSQVSFFQARCLWHSQPPALRSKELLTHCGSQDFFLPERSFQNLFLRKDWVFFSEEKFLRSRKGWKDTKECTMFGHTSPSCCCSAADWTQGLRRARQVLYHWVTSPAHRCLWSGMGDELCVWVGGDREEGGPAVAINTSLSE